MKKTNKTKLFSFRYLFYDFVKLTSAIPGLIWFRPKWRFLNEKARGFIRGGAIAISNHDGFFDPIYLMFAIWYRRHRFICRKEFFDSWAKLFFKGFLCIPIDKSSFGMNSFREITDSLKAGYLVSMFPEGQINSGDGIAAFKSGVVLMALQGKVPIIPVYIRGKKHFWNRVIFVIGEAIDIQALYGDRPTFSQIESIAQLLHEREEKLKEYIQKEES